MKYLLAGCLILLSGCAGYKTTLVVGVQKDWCVDRPYSDVYYHPDLKTKAELRFEGNKK